MVTSELARWSRTAGNTTELLTSIISCNADMGATVIKVSEGNGNFLVKKKSLHN